MNHQHTNLFNELMSFIESVSAIFTDIVTYLKNILCEMTAFNFHDNMWKSDEQTAAVTLIQIDESAQEVCFHAEYHHH